MPELTNFSVSIRIPFVGALSGSWVPDEAEKQAAWEMYVELVTRVSVVELQPTEGSLREVLTSLHSLFGTTREIMRRHGPAVARPRRGADLSFGSIAIAVLNGAIRPVLSRWHVELLAHEATIAPGASPVAHEREWAQAAELREALQDLRETLVDYAQLLGRVAGVPSLVLDADRRAGSTA